MSQAELGAASVGTVRVCLISAEYRPNVYGGLGRHVTDLVQALTARDV